MILDSGINVFLLSTKSREKLFEDIKDILDRGDQPEYIEHGGNSLTLLDASCGIGVDKGERHHYPFSNNYIDIGLLAEDFVHRPHLLENGQSLVTNIHNSTDIQYGFGMISREGPEDPRQFTPPVSDESLAQNRINYPTWLMLFPPEMVETYGREWLLDLPAERIDELDDGAIMVVATTAITECDTDEEIQETVTEAMAPIIEAFEDHSVPLGD